MSDRTARLACAYLVTLASTLGIACAPDEEALIVRYVPMWPIEEERLVCGVEVDSQDGDYLTLLRGRLDLSFDSGYMQPYALENNLTAGGGPTSGNNGTDDSEMEVRAASVRLELPQDPRIIETLRAIDPALVEFRVDLQTLSIPGGGRQGMLLESIPRTTAEALREVILQEYDPGVALTVMTRTIFHADRGSNSSLNDNNKDKSDKLDFFEVDSREFGFPIELCFGCLRFCPTNPGNASRVVASGLCGNAQDGAAIPAGCSIPEDDG